MASKSYPRAGYNAGAVTELEHERLVNAVAPDGLLGDPFGSAMVYADGAGTRQVRIRANRLALVRGSLYDSGDNDITLTLASNSSGATRTDLVVLRLSRTDYSVAEAVITGTPGAGAPAPVQQTGSTGFWDLPLAEVTVVAGAVQLGAGDVAQRAWFVGEDGDIRCTSTTRPPHQAGRIIRELNTNRTLQSSGVGGKWLVLFEDTGWVPLTTASGFAPGGEGCWARRKNGWVHMSITVRRTGSAIGASTNAVLATLPADTSSGLWRPSRELISNMVVSSPDHETLGFVGTNGKVTLLANFSQGINNGAFVTTSTSFPVDEI